MLTIIFIGIFYQYDNEIYVNYNAFHEGDSVKCVIDWRLPLFLFYEKNGQINFRNIWKIKINKKKKEFAEDFTLSKDSLIKSTFLYHRTNLTLPYSKKYPIKVTFIDKNSNFSIEKEFTINKYSNYIEDIKIESNPENYPKDSLKIFFRLLEGDSVLVSLKSIKKRELVQMKRVNTTTKKETTIIFSLNNQNREYTLCMDIFKDNIAVEKYCKKVKIPIPFWYIDDEYKKMVNYLIYLGSRKDIEKLASLPINKRKEGWENFWEKFDPTPLTVRNEFEEEYMRRVFYAEEHFIFGDKGYKSPRGEIYIKLGPPDEIEKHPFDQNTRSYEIWYYYNKGKKFIFMDVKGFGEYEMVYPRR